MTIEEACRILNINISDIDDKVKLKKAYKEQALLCHPDRGGSEDSFKLLSEAYTLASDYDFIPEASHTNVKPSFGKNRKARRARALDPKDVVINIVVTVKELYRGFEQRINYSRRKACNRCKGSGCDVCLGAIGVEQLEVAVYIHSSLMNGNMEIIYDGLGDITYEAADLILVLKVDDPEFQLKYFGNDEYPSVYSEHTMGESETETVVNTLAGPVKLKDITPEMTIVRLKDKGLLFEHKNGIKKSHHYINLKRY